MVVVFLVLNRKVIMKIVNEGLLLIGVIILGSLLFNFINPWIGIATVLGYCYYKANVVWNHIEEKK